MGSQRTRADKTATRIQPALALSAPVQYMVALLIIGGTLVAYIPAIRAGFIWDDDAYLTNNPLVRSPGGLGRIWLEPSASPQYYPLVFTSFWIEYRIWGLAPAGYHLVNVLLHAGSAIVLWRLLRRLAVPGALQIAAIFALHPIQAESVAWITERKNTLSGLFYLLSIYAYLRWDEVKSRGHWYGLAVLFFVAALLSKSVTATMPAAALLILWWKRGRLARRDVTDAMPFFALGIIAAFHTAWLEKHHVGAGDVAWGLSALDRCLLAGRIILFYLGKLVWPANLTFIYPRWEIDAGVWWQYLFPLGVVIVIAALCRWRRRIGRGPLAGFLFFCGTLVPVLGFVKVYPMIFSYVADHFQYLAGIGVIALVVAAVTQFLKTRNASAPLRLVLSAVVLSTCLGLTWQRALAYHDEETLYRDTIARNSQAWMAYNNLGALLRERKQNSEAMELCQKALKLNPAYAEAHVNVGDLLVQSGKTEEGLQHLFEAVRLKPVLAVGQYSLANMLVGLKRFDEARSHFQEGVRVEPTNWDARAAYARALWQASRGDLAITEYQEVIKSNPNNPMFRNDMAIILAGQGRTNEAIEHFQRALQLTPGDANMHFNLGRVLQGAGRYAEAINEFRAVLAINPGDPDAERSLQEALRRERAP